MNKGKKKLRYIIIFFLLIYIIYIFYYRLKIVIFHLSLSNNVQKNVLSQILLSLI